MNMINEHGAGPTPTVPGLSIEQSGFQINPVTAPQQLDRDGMLSFRLTGPNGDAVTDYDTSHGKDLHLIAVRADGTHFRHVHPTNEGDGVWSVPWRWNAAGTYRVFADFVPSALGASVVLTTTLHIGGAFAPVTREVSTVAEAGGFTVHLRGSFGVGSPSDLTFFVFKEGEPVTSLEPYLEAFGHLVALREGDLGFLHVHPMGHAGEDVVSSGPEISFMAQAPTVGIYFLYLDFQVAGTVHTAGFVVVADRKPGIGLSDHEHGAMDHSSP